MATTQLSKSSYIRSLQCLKSLYLYKFHYTQRDKLSREQQAKFSRGHDIGKLAHQLFPGGVDASISARQKSLQAQLRTFELLQQGHKIIYEASFVHDEIWVIADVIEKTESGWNVYEVKSSLALSETYMNDAALQFYVISNAMQNLLKEPVNDFSLIYVNRNYVLKDKLEPEKLFIKSSVKSFCTEQLPLTMHRINKAKAVIEGGKVPAIETGDHCFTPYPCDFTNTCWKNKPLPGNLNPDFNLAEIEKLKHLHNYYLLNYLELRPAMPLFRNTRPYQRLIYHFDVLSKIDGNEIMNQFTADQALDPNLMTIPQLIDVLKQPYPILTTDFNNLTKTITEIAEYYPEYKSSLQLISERLIDVTDCFEKKDGHADFNTEQLLRWLKIKRPFVKESIYDQVGADKIFIEMQSTNDLFSNEESKNQIKAYSKINTDLIQQAIAKIVAPGIN